MNFWRSSFQSVAANLACDEVMLAHVESTGEAWLRTWFPQSTAVVLGYANRYRQEILLDICRNEDIAVRRRMSGGGCVVLLPGCLCYSLTLPIVAGTPFQRISSTNRFIMETHRHALEDLAQQPASIEGVTDLSFNGRKFSGNSQKRRRNALLFHGTILYQADLALLSRCLAHPPTEPDWRKNRPHERFVGNFHFDRDAIEGALKASWSAHSQSEPELGSQVEQLSQAKYEQDSWTFSR